MAFLAEEALQRIGFAKIGRHVKVSDKVVIYDADQMALGNNFRIDDFCVVSGRLSMGRNTYIGCFGLIAGGKPGIVFEDFTTLAYRVQVFTQSDDYRGETLANPTVPKRYKPGFPK